MSEDSCQDTASAVRNGIAGMAASAAALAAPKKATVTLPSNGTPRRHALTRILNLDLQKLRSSYRTFHPSKTAKGGAARISFSIRSVEY